MTSFTETDFLWSASPSFGITNTNISNWNTAYGWGNHATAGYLTSFAETDPLWSASPSFGITNTNISNWNTAYSWGNHSTAGYLTSFTETDPLWSASPSFGITNTNITDWNTAYSWGNHATAGYLTSFMETDPIFINNFDISGSTTGDLLKFDGTKYTKFTSNFTESNYNYIDLKYGAKLMARNDAQANLDFVISPKGTGANMAQEPDGSTVGGKSRGNYATDWQKIRNNSSEVASGIYSTVSGGFSNTARGYASVVSGGYSNNAYSYCSSVIGGYGNFAKGSFSMVSGIYNNAPSYGETTLGFYATEYTPER